MMKLSREKLKGEQINMIVFSAIFLDRTTDFTSLHLYSNFYQLDHYF